MGSVEIECPDCNGTGDERPPEGLTISQHDCVTCGGKGKIEMGAFSNLKIDGLDGIEALPSKADEPRLGFDEKIEFSTEGWFHGSPKMN